MTTPPPFAASRLFAKNLESADLALVLQIQPKKSIVLSKPLSARFQIFSKGFLGRFERYQKVMAKKNWKTIFASSDQP